MLFTRALPRGHVTRLLFVGLLLLSTAPLSAQTATVNANDVKQRIDGFGASDRNEEIALTDAYADLFFSPTAGIGLSLLRVSIDTDGTMNNGLYTNAAKASARGALIWAAPWTAAASMKDNNDIHNGGHLKSSSYGAWSDLLAGYQALLLAKAGVPLYTLSVQNEPDFAAGYDSMLYTNAEMVAFLKVLGPKVAALNPRPKIMISEVSNAASSAGYINAILADATAKPYLDLVAWHQYFGVASPIGTYPNWQTEMSYFSGFDAGMPNALAMARDIHTALTTANATAWHYWELFGHQNNNEGLIGADSGVAGDATITKRLYALGNYSKFIRPGAFRVGVSTGNVPSGVSISAYKAPGNGGVVVVVVNTSGANVTLTTTLQGLVPTTMTPYVTSSTQNLAALTPISVSAGAFTATIGNNTVTTLVGTATLQPPAPQNFRVIP